MDGVEAERDGFRQVPGGRRTPRRVHGFPQYTVYSSATPNPGEGASYFLTCIYREHSVHSLIRESLARGAYFS
jgi:hypothetical protein